eukprot:gene2006-2468_t
MSTTEVPAFSTPQEEIQYWKKRLEDKQQELDELETNFTEYQEFSKQLEEEMEGELKACEKKYAEVQSQHARLKNDHESLLEKFNQMSRESTKLTNSLQDEVQKLQTIKQTLMEDKRRLEQENDSLERRERASMASANYLTEKLDIVMEENVWIQSELEESKQTADETIQRLRDDIRDLKHELSVRERKPNILIKQASSSTTTTTEKSKRENPMAYNIPRPQKSQRLKADDTPSSRAGSLVVVSELINLVTDLESRISSFRQSRQTTSNSISSPSDSTPISPILKSSNSLSNFKDFLPINNNNNNNNNNSSLLNQFLDISNNHVKLNNFETNNTTTTNVTTTG